MEILSVDFLVALASIVVIDLVLAGDNAIVIALAARNVPRHLQRRAIIAGTAGAVIVRSSMTLLVVWLLKIPGLQLVGGLLLVYIACKLLRPEEDKGDAHGADSASSFWGAMRTIVVADAIMGLDNVLGVAGAAHGSFLLVVLGLLISVPIVIWGSTLVLRLVERHPPPAGDGRGVGLPAPGVEVVGLVDDEDRLPALPLAEEAAEVLLASKNGTEAEIVYEMADLWFHALVLLGHHTIHPHEVLRELQRRFGQPGGGKQIQAAHSETPS